MASALLVESGLYAAKIVMDPEHPGLKKLELGTRFGSVSVSTLPDGKVTAELVQAAPGVAAFDANTPGTATWSWNEATGNWDLVTHTCPVTPSTPPPKPPAHDGPLVVQVACDD
jgi:hypothetical protein